MNHYEAVNILDMLNAIGEDAVKNILSDFSCPKNFEIESFVKQNALEFAKRKMSITYLVIDEEGQLAAIFALTHKAVQLTNEGLSGSMRKKIERHAKLDEQSNTYMLSAFLIAQFGKNAQYTEKITGNELMDMTMNILVAVQREIGGGVVYLECEERPQLLTFYENEQNRFRVFGERCKSIRLIKTDLLICNRQRFIQRVQVHKNLMLQIMPQSVPAHHLLCLRIKMTVDKNQWLIKVE